MHHLVAVFYNNVMVLGNPDQTVEPQMALVTSTQLFERNGFGLCVQLPTVVTAANSIMLCSEGFDERSRLTKYTRICFCT